MRKSKVLQKLREGEVASCFKVNTCDPAVVEIAAMAGFDCIWTDLEHVPNDWSVIKNQVMAAKVNDADLMVRVARGSYSDYIKPFELDAAGIMIPHVMSCKQARDVVEITRFHPRGRRPIDGGNADGAYSQMPLDSYIKHSNNHKFVMIQIEDPEAVEELDTIAAVDGIDMLFFGALDFSHSIGAPGERDHPDVREAMKKVAETARANGKYAGAAANKKNLDDILKMGYTFIKIGADVAGLWDYCEELSGLFDKHKP